MDRPDRTLGVTVQEIVQDAEYYVLEAQNGQRWEAEDKELEARLAREEADRQVALLAEQKAARDARYAARKKRKSKARA